CAECFAAPGFGGCHARDEATGRCRSGRRAFLSGGPLSGARRRLRGRRRAIPGFALRRHSGVAARRLHPADPAMVSGAGQRDADYRGKGAIFWPDVGNGPRPNWPAWGVADPGWKFTIESGEFVLNKRASWRPLNLAWFYNDHSDYYYRHGCGDKHTFEVAWAR